MQKKSRVRICIAANAGFYTFLDFAAKYPYGIKNTEINSDE